MSLQAKIVLPPLIALLSMLLLGAVGAYGLRAQNAVLDDFFTVHYARHQKAMALETRFLEIRSTLQQLVELSRTNANAANVKTLVDANTVAMAQAVAELKQWRDTADAGLGEGKPLGEAYKAADEYAATSKQLLDMLDVDPNMAGMMLSGANAKFSVLAQALDQVVRLQDRRAVAARQDGKRVSQQVLGFFALMFGLAVLATGATAYLLGKRLGGALRVLIDALLKGASGDLRAPLPTRGNDELARAAGAFNQMRDFIGELVHSIRSQVEHVQSASAAIEEKTGASLALGEQQSEETTAAAAALEEIATSVSHLANLSADAQNSFAKTHAQTVSTLENTRSAALAAMQSAETVTETASMVRGLKDASGEIRSIAGVIHEIADQTNLLALNAAIEAARAGEQGRGFAVVADEVRKLAERTSHATQDIGRLIDTIVAQTEQTYLRMNACRDLLDASSAQSHEIAQTMEGVQAQTRVSLDDMREMVAALREQDRALLSISNNMERLSSQTEATQGLVVESATTAKSLAGAMSPLLALTDKVHV